VSFNSGRVVLFAPLALLALATLYVASYVASGVLWLRSDDAKAKMRTTGAYDASLVSLKSHTVPRWYKDAKFGVFVHWGLFSVPGFAPNGQYKDVLRTNYDQAMVVSPYAEDYANAMRDRSTPTGQFHARTYGSAPYASFKSVYEDGLRYWDADAWAKQFKDYGAKYVVVTAKYHDGFCIWPTNVRNPHQPDWHTDRDVLGELATAVRKQGLKFGVYYSGGVDWTFQPQIVRTLGEYAYLYHGDDYADYADAQVRELIQRYKPDILWNDISWPTGQKRLNAMFVDYYNTVPDGVVNDRWQTATAWTKFKGTWVNRKTMDTLIKLAINNDSNFIENVKPPSVPHSDFTTPEYTQYATTQQNKWETTRGIGYSFGYNQNETDKEYASFEQTLFPSFADAVAKNGNLLLNIGPSGGRGAIPGPQQRRLAAFGAWLQRNGTAIYGSSPWKTAQTITDTGLQVRFTTKADTVYVVVVGQVRTATIRLKGIRLAGTGTLLGSNQPVTVTQNGNDTLVHLAQPVDEYSPAIAIRP